jgi:hypothetical protein
MHAKADYWRRNATPFRVEEQDGIAAERGCVRAPDLPNPTQSTKFAAALKMRGTHSGSLAVLLYMARVTTCDAWQRLSGRTRATFWFREET